jgi:TolB protein
MKKTKKPRTFKFLSFVTSLMIFAGLLLNGCAVRKPIPVIPPPPDNFKGLRRIISHPSQDMFPEVSPDGALVAYAAQKGDTFDIFYFDPYKKKILVTQVTRHVSNDTSPSWSADSKEIYFTSARLKTLSIWRKKIKGGPGIRQITVREDANDFDSSISPDGTKMVFCSQRASKKSSITPFFFPVPWAKRNITVPTLWISNIDGSMMTQIGAGFNPRWSPDGSKILFHKPSGDNLDIWMIKADGSELIQLTHDKADDKDASWSPDGKMIAFSSDRQKMQSYTTEKNFDIWVMDLEQERQTQLTYSPFDDGAPFWARSGYIFFHSNRNDTYDIWVGTPVIEWKEGQ